MGQPVAHWSTSIFSANQLPILNTSYIALILKIKNKLEKSKSFFFNYSFVEQVGRLEKNSGKPPSVHNLIPSARSYKSSVHMYHIFHWLAKKKKRLPKKSASPHLLKPTYDQKPDFFNFWPNNNLEIRIVMQFSALSSLSLKREIVKIHQSRKPTLSP